MTPTKGSSRTWRTLCAATLAIGLLVSRSSIAAENPISLGEVAPLPSAMGTDPLVLRDVAASELQQLDVSRIPARRKVVVSIAMTKAVADKTIACTVNAMLRDAKTGAMLAIIEAGAQADGPASAELRKQVTHAAVRQAVQRIPRALGGK
jgi:hypothetical protein